MPFRHKNLFKEFLLHLYICIKFVDYFEKNIII